MERNVYLLAPLAMVLAIAGMRSHAQIVEPTTAPNSGNTASPATQYWFAANGSDSNACTLAAPCLSQSKMTSLAQAGNATFHLRGGDEFRWAYAGCANRVNSTNTTTYATNPVACQNITVDSYGTGQAIFEGAIRIDSGFGTWAAYDANGTYMLTYPAGTLYAENFFVDTQHKDSAAAGHLNNEPNGPALTYAAGTTYYPGDLVNQNGKNYVLGGRGTNAGNPSVDVQYWRNSPPPEADITKSGIANVQANPGSTYNDTKNGKLYVHLTDGSNPASHVMQASVLDVGIQCESCNGWRLQNLEFEKYVLAGAAFINYSMANSTNQYYTNINNQIDSSSFWDNTSELRWFYQGPSNAQRIWRSSHVIMMFNSLSSATADEMATGWKVTNSYFGRNGPLPQRAGGDGTWSSVYLNGGTNMEVGGNNVVPWVDNGISAQNGSNPWVHDNVLVGQLRGCAICYSNNHGLLVERNHVAYGAGDAFQGGGYSYGTGTWDVTGHPELDVPGAYPQIVRYNLCHDYGIVNGALYNCWDTNTNQPVKGMLFDHNTCVNSDSGCYTFEVNNNSAAGAGVTDVTFRYNIASQHKVYSVYTDRAGVQGLMNNSLLLYFANTTVPGQNGYFHSYKNVFQTGSNNSPIAKVGSLASFYALVGDTTSITVPNTSDPIFTNITTSVLTLKAGSPALNQPVGGQYIGSTIPDFNQIFGARFGGYSFVAGQAARH